MLDENVPPSFNQPDSRALGVDRVIYTSHTPKPLEELGLDTHKATKLAFKLHAHSVQYAYELVSNRCALLKTCFDSYQQDQAKGTRS
eukprot:1140752-Pelagomonas_calceolata.AAC.1